MGTFFGELSLLPLAVASIADSTAGVPSHGGKLRVGKWNVSIAPLTGLSPCIVTGLTESYVDGHEVFVRTLLRQNSWFTLARWPLVVIDQGLSARSRARILQLYRYTRCEASGGARLVPQGAVLNRGDAQSAKWRANLEKLFHVMTMQGCAPVVKMDTGDMLVLGDVAELLHRATSDATAVMMVAALAHPTLNNGGLVILGKSVLEQQVVLEGMRKITNELHMSREQEVFARYLGGSANAGHARLQRLPKKYNTEWSYWRHVGHRALLQPRDVAIVHYVGLKPWQLTRPPRGDLHAGWWREHARGRLLVVGSLRVALSERSSAGWVADQYSLVARLHGDDLGSTSTSKIIGSQPASCAGGKLTSAPDSIRRHASVPKKVAEFVLSACLAANGGSLEGVLTLGVDDTMLDAFNAAWNAYVAQRTRRGEPFPLDSAVRRLAHLYVPRSH